MPTRSRHRTRARPPAQPAPSQTLAQQTEARHKRARTHEADVLELLAEAEPLWSRVVEDQSAEPVPRSLALLGLARLEAARGRPMASKGHLDEVRVLAADPWLIAEADRLVQELASAREPAAALP